MLTKPSLARFCGIPCLDLSVIDSLRPLINPAAFVSQQAAMRQVTKKRTRACYEDVDSDGELSESGSEAEDPAASHSRSQRQPLEVLAAISRDCLGELETLLTQKAQIARNEGRSLCRRPRRFVLWGVYRDRDDEGRWDGAEPRVSVAYEVLAEWWEECLTGRSRWSDENDIP